MNEKIPKKDPIFKNILGSYLSKYGVELIKESEISTANMRIDFIINNFTNKIIKEHSPFKYFTEHNIGEFKSENDFFQTGDFFILNGKLNIYMGQNYGYGNNKSKLDRIDHKTISGIIIISGHTKLPRFYHNNFDVLELEAGIYRIETKINHSILFVLSSSIELNNFNYYFGLFTNKNFENFKEFAIKNNDNFILTIAHILFKGKIESDNKAMEVLNKRGYTIKESIEEIGLGRVIEEIGLGRVIEEIGLGRVIEEIDLKDIVAVLSEKDKKILRTLLG